MTKVVVTGAGGYIGTQLIRDLVKQDYEVLGVDRFFFGMEPVQEFLDNKKVKFLKKDIRDIEISDLIGYDAVCDLACLSNDPAGEIDPLLTYQINRDGRIHVAKTSKNAGINKYILSSSCSVYGQGEQPKLSEESPTNPISVYAKSTLEAEKINLQLADNNFSVTALRNATVFGLSTRMRFDLVVNLMTLSAYQKNRILIMGGGLQWRPLVHVSDVAKAFITVIEASKDKVSGEIFNIGLDNFQIKNLAYIVKEELPINVEIEIAPDDADKRDYNVVFSKSERVLGFKPATSVSHGVKEIYDSLKLGKVDTGDKTVTVKWYKNILEAQKLVDSVYLNNRII
jgi:nucleoside-diphosphate-sugar epimerase